MAVTRQASQFGGGREWFKFNQGDAMSTSLIAAWQQGLAVSASRRESRNERRITTTTHPAVVVFEAIRPGIRATSATRLT